MCVVRMLAPVKGVKCSVLYHRKRSSECKFYTLETRTSSIRKKFFNFILLFFFLLFSLTKKIAFFNQKEKIAQLYPCLTNKKKIYTMKTNNANKM